VNLTTESQYARAELEPLDADRGRLTIEERRGGNYIPRVGITRVNYTSPITITHSRNTLSRVLEGKIEKPRSSKNGHSRQVWDRYSHLSGNGDVVNNLAHALLLERPDHLARHNKPCKYPAADLHEITERYIPKSYDWDFAFQALEANRREFQRNAVNTLTRNSARPNWQRVRAMLDAYKNVAEISGWLIGENIHLVGGILEKRKEPRDQEDFAHGLESLARAVDAFDISRGFKFSTYACRTIIQQIKRNRIRRKSPQLAEWAEPETNPEVDGEETIRRLMLREIMQTNSANLDERQREILLERFGYSNPEGESRTLKQVANKFGVSRERIRQLEKKALKKLRTTFMKKYRQAHGETPV
jgi:RNA polymerase sigma factor (sigma-70 family)